MNLLHVLQHLCAKVKPSTVSLYDVVHNTLPVQYMDSDKYM